MRWLALLFVAGCSSSSGPIDASTSDLATSFCVGTPLDGTCAQAFLAPLYACLQASGACSAASTTKACWPSGGEVALSTTSTSGGTDTQLTATRDGVVCFASSRTGSSSSPYVVSSSNASLSYFQQAGKLLCPDNTQIVIGADYGGCDAFRLLLTGPDFSTCAAGTCP